MGENQQYSYVYEEKLKSFENDEANSKLVNWINNNVFYNELASVYNRDKKLETEKNNRAESSKKIESGRNKIVVVFIQEQQHLETKKGM